MTDAYLWMMVDDEGGCRFWCSSPNDTEFVHHSLAHKPKLQVATKALPDEAEAIARIGSKGWEVEA